MYTRVQGPSAEGQNGAILADAMGLGCAACDMHSLQVTFPELTEMCRKLVHTCLSCNKKCIHQMMSMVHQSFGVSDIVSDHRL